MRTLRNRQRRVALTFLAAVTPTAAIAWAGCSSDLKGTPPLATADPGGTYGAELAVTVVGRGRVATSNIPGVNCPNDCFARYVFSDRSQDGAAGGVTLKAIPTRGIKFLGWKFETASLGTRGRGPEICNPVKRDSTTPQVDLNALEITLPYGEVQGISPPGQEGVCVGTTTVPSAYKITATFESDIVEAGVDADAEGGAGDIFLEPPINLTGYQAKEIGILGSRLYVRYENGGFSQIASAFTSGGAFTVVSGSSGNYSAFEMGSNGAGHVVWQSSGQINVITSGNTFVQTFSSGGNNCVALESDFSNVFCRTAGPNGNMVSWTTAGTNLTGLHSGLPEGTEFAVDFSNFYIADTSGGTGATAIRYIPRSATLDAGVPTFNDSTTATLVNPPFGLELNTSRLLWLDYDVGANVGIAQSGLRTGGGTPFSSSPATQGLRLLATDPQSTLQYFVGVVPSSAAGASGIARLSTSNTTAITVRQNLTGVGGIAADNQYVYWTQSDGRVYRAQRIGF